MDLPLLCSQPEKASKADCGCPLARQLKLETPDGRPPAKLADK